MTTAKGKSYDMRAIMLRAWKLYRKNSGLCFGECLHRAWESEKAAPVNAQRISTAKAAAGIAEDCRTWAGWRDAGYMVEHGSRALFKCDLIHAAKGDGAIYKASFFGASQVQVIA